MSSRVNARALKNVLALIGILFGATTIAGCSSFSAFPTTAHGSDKFVTGTVGQSGQGNPGQSMPGVLQNSNTASGPYLPPANIGGAGTIVPMTTAGITRAQLPPPLQNSSTSMSAQALPAPLQSSSVGSQQSMPAQIQSVASNPPRITQPFPDNARPQVAPASSVPALRVVAEQTYKHTIESGESLYTIARRYDVTTAAIVQANGLSAPDQVYVGQHVIIPGRSDLLASRAATTSVTQSTTAVVDKITTASVPTPQTHSPVAQQTSQATPVQVASVTPPATSSTDGFRWPVNGRVIADFAASRQTGINIEAPGGASVRAAENGNIIYVGNGVEGYGNLILVRHDNGYVSAYAHLKDVTVAKGDAVHRGDQIGTVGMSGSVNRPQLHFELRQGATPVDPMPLLAS